MTPDIIGKMPMPLPLSPLRALRVLCGSTFHTPLLFPIHHALPPFTARPMAIRHPSP